MNKAKYGKIQIPSPWETFNLWQNINSLAKRIYKFGYARFISLRKFKAFLLKYLDPNSEQHSNRYLNKILGKHQDTLTFLKVWLKNPLTMGAVAPSSKYLAREMAAHIATNPKGIILELGPGTGVITEALLQAGISPEKLVILEYSSALANNLRQRFPGVCVIEGNAINLTSLLEHESREISSIVSSLPLRAFSKMTTLAILEQITTLLHPGSKFIQFTYSFRKNRFAILTHYRQIASKRIWRNLPPARVDVWEIC